MYCPTASLTSRLLFNLLHLPLILPSQLTNDRPPDLGNTFSKYITSIASPLLKLNIHFLQYFPDHIVHISGTQTKMCIKIT